MQPVISGTGHYAGTVRTRDNPDLGTNNSCSLLSPGRDKQGLYRPVTTLTWAQIILAGCYLWDGMQNVSTHNTQIVSHSLRVHTFFCSALFIVVFMFFFQKKFSTWREKIEIAFIWYNNVFFLRQAFIYFNIIFYTTNIG